MSGNRKKKGKAGRPPLSESGSTQIAIRIPKKDLELADEIAVRFESMGFTKSRSSVLRAAVRRGLDVLNDELPAVGLRKRKRPPIKRQPVPRPPKQS